MLTNDFDFIRIFREQTGVALPNIAIRRDVSRDSHAFAAIFLSFDQAGNSCRKTVKILFKSSRVVRTLRTYRFGRQQASRPVDEQTAKDEADHLKRAPEWTRTESLLRVRPSLDPATLCELTEEPC